MVSKNRTPKGGPGAGKEGKMVGGWHKKKKKKQPPRFFGILF